MKRNIECFYCQEPLYYIGDPKFEPEYRIQFHGVREGIGEYPLQNIYCHQRCWEESSVWAYKYQKLVQERDAFLILAQSRLEAKDFELFFRAVRSQELIKEAEKELQALGYPEHFTEEDARRHAKRVLQLLSLLK